MIFNNFRNFHPKNVQEYDKNGAIFLYDAYEDFINGAIWKYASKPIKRTLNHVCTTNKTKKAPF